MRPCRRRPRRRTRVEAVANRLWWAALVLAALGLIALSVPYALSARYLERAGADPAAVTDLKRAIAWDGRNVRARRALAQVYLAHGQPQAALDALQPTLDMAPPNPMVQIESAAPFVALGRPDEAILAYDASGILPRSAAAAAAFLGQAGAGDPLTAADLWRKALFADPGNLYALTSLWRGARAAGDNAAAADLGDQLRYFDLRSVAVPVDTHLAGFQARAMADLVEADVWTRETLLNVVSYQVWQFADGDAGRRAEQVLNGLLARWPDDADLRFFKAELYHRRGDWQQAEAAYRAVLEADAAYTQAYLRLGMVFQVRDELATAADWYTRYRALAPDDLLGLKRLVEVQETLGVTEAAALREELLDRTDARWVAAELLHLPVEDIDLGPDLIYNGDFETWEGRRPLGWKWSNMASGNPWNRGQFLGGMDNLDTPSGTAARVQGLWLERREDREPGRCGFVQLDEKAWAQSNSPGHGVRLVPGDLYLLQLLYRTSGTPNRAATVFTSQDSEAFSVERGLPVTHGHWHRLVVISSNRTGVAAELTLLLRSWEPGNVSFDDISLRRIDTRLPVDIPVLDLPIWLAGPSTGQ